MRWSGLGGGLKVTNNKDAVMIGSKYLETHMDIKVDHVSSIPMFEVQ